jgi:hypothetical protein
LIFLISIVLGNKQLISRFDFQPQAHASITESRFGGCVFRAAVSDSLIFFGLWVPVVPSHIVISGKCFPCDTCHDASEDHPAVWANRMLCGYCGLEQPFSSKPCSCGSLLAKSSSMTRFWEGGKGNRNTRALSKNDSKKSVFFLPAQYRFGSFCFAGTQASTKRYLGALAACSCPSLSKQLLKNNFRA